MCDDGGLIFDSGGEIAIHNWLTIHDFMGLVLLFGSLHAFFIDSDVSFSWPLRWWFFMMLAGA